MTLNCRLLSFCDDPFIFILDSVRTVFCSVPPNHTAVGRIPMMYSIDLRSNGLPCEVLSPRLFKRLAISKNPIPSFAYQLNIIRTISASLGTIIGGLPLSAGSMRKIRKKDSGRHLELLQIFICREEKESA